MSQLAYETDRDKINDICRKLGIGLVDEPIHRSITTGLPVASTYVMLLDLGDAVVVSFAGTDPVVIANWISDFDTRAADGGAAEGFATALRAVEADIVAALPANRPLLITGHSLGGALAVLLAQHLTTGNRQNAAVYTFGMPRAGRSDFAGPYNS